MLKRKMLFVSGILLVVVFVKSVLSQGCMSTSRITTTCYCHFVGACNWTQTPPAPLLNAAQALPQGIESNFASQNPNPNTDEICEGIQRSLAILYECDLRIPLYAARVLTDADLLAKYNAKTQRTSFRETRALLSFYRQKNGDYGPRPKDQISCYETNTGGGARMTLYYDANWWPPAFAQGPPPQACNKKNVGLAAIDKGHLIASNYGKSAANSKITVKDTFYLSNVVPQFAELNRIAWLQHEQALLKWAINTCSSAKAGRQNARLFILVGTLFIEN